MCCHEEFRKKRESRKATKPMEQNKTVRYRLWERRFFSFKPYEPVTKPRPTNFARRTPKLFFYANVNAIRLPAGAFPSRCAMMR